MSFFKQLIAGAILALTIASPAMAAGPYDGIYQSQLNPNAYASLHQNGSSVIVAIFYIGSVTGVTLNSAVGRVGPTNLDVWELFQGTLVGTHGTLSGQSEFHACAISGTLDFDSIGNAVVTVTTITPTTYGISQNVNCSASSSKVGMTQKFNRAY